MQAHAPLLAQARVRRFLEHHRIITARRARRAAEVARTIADSPYSP
jgi:hypothetical protein